MALKAEHGLSFGQISRVNDVMQKKDVDLELSNRVRIVAPLVKGQAGGLASREVASAARHLIRCRHHRGKSRYYSARGLVGSPDAHQRVGILIAGVIQTGYGYPCR